ncbi:hypothetical protein I6F15_04445 [Bradyrhizobium sp. BRP14]|nr:hypothetical protein [Bradyrhizobium sp. BRP14]
MSQEKGFEEQLVELGYDDLVPVFRAAVQQGAQATIAAQRQQASRDGWFQSLYKAHPSLKDHPDTVQFVMQRDMADLADLPASQAIDEVASRVNRRLEAQKNHDRYMAERRAYSGGPDGELQHVSVDEFEASGMTAPGSLGDTIRKRREKLFGSRRARTA